MSVLKKLLILSCLIGFALPAHASFGMTDVGSWTVFNEAEDDKKTGEEEEEPDCE